MLVFELAEFILTLLTNKQKKKKIIKTLFSNIQILKIDMNIEYDKCINI